MAEVHGSELAGVLSELCWPDANGRMCCRLMRDLRYVDLSRNEALSAAQLEEELDDSHAPGDKHYCPLCLHCVTLLRSLVAAPVLTGIIVTRALQV